MLTFCRRLQRASIGAVLALLVASCGESTVSQCNRLAEIVNQAQNFMPEFESDIEAFSTDAAQVESLEDIKEAADQYVAAVDKVVGSLEGLVTELETTDLSDEQLTTFRGRYIDMVEGFSNALTQASEAMSIVRTVEAEADLPAKIEESQQQTVQAVQLIQDLSVQESAIIGEVNTYCGAETPPTDAGTPEPETSDPEG